MYRSFSITNFRCFRSLEVKGLKRVNLIAGRNNAGKTALLEAIYLHAAQADPRSIDYIIRGRGTRPTRTEEGRGDLLWGSLFHEFDDSDAVCIQAAVGPKEEQLPFEPPSTWVSISAATTDDLAELWRNYAEPTLDYASHGPADVEFPDVLKLEYSGDRIDTRRTYYSTDRDFTRFASREGLGGARYTNRAVFLQARTAWGEYDTLRFRELAEGKRTQELVAALSVIEPRLTDIQTLPVDSRSMALFGDVGLSRLVALGDMGDGMNRLASLVLAISGAKGGAVLVDEIENGFHYSVHEDVWRVIAEALDRFDVQLFATTHSRECIAAAHAVFSEGKASDFGLHRLERLGERVLDVVYDQGTLGAALESGMEVL